MRKLAAFGCLWAVAAPPAHGQRRQSPHSVHQSRRRGPAARVGSADNHGTVNPLRPPVSLVDDTVCAAIPCTHAHWGPLLRRSLDSVAKQTRRVDRVVVVLSLVGRGPRTAGPRMEKDFPCKSSVFFNVVIMTFLSVRVDMPKTSSGAC